MVKSEIITERAFEFARRSVKVCERRHPRSPISRHMAAQLLKCATSIGANAEEAEAGQSKPDFIAKLSISRKEAYEARYWLRLAVASSVATSKELVWELDEITQLIAMLTSALKTARALQNRGEDSQTLQDLDG